jgi:hypothetical protein
MEKFNIDNLFKKREKLLERLSFYNDPPMFNTCNYEPHKKRIRKQLWKITDILCLELNIDKKGNAF